MYINYILDFTHVRTVMRSVIKLHPAGLLVTIGLQQNVLVVRGVEPLVRLSAFADCMSSDPKDVGICK